MNSTQNDMPNDMQHNAPSSDGLLSVEQARGRLLEAASQLAFSTRSASTYEILSTIEANARVLAASQVSGINVPPFQNAQMDGYAVRAEDCASGQARLRVTQRIAAGYVGTPIEPGSAARIFTGATIPPGADAVVMQELCEVDPGSQGQQVTVRHKPRVGEWIRLAGEDIEAGKQILAAGTRLNPLSLGLAAAVGLATLPVMPRLRVAVFFTGDELVMPGESLQPGAIYNANRFLVCALLENLGCRVSDFGTVPDSLAATRQTLHDAAQNHDVVITCGGVSVGEEDHVRAAVQTQGSVEMWRIAVKPGKPLAFGTLRREASDEPKTFFFGLPGNPVSALITFLLFVRPFLLRLQGVQQVLPKAFAMRADFCWPKADRRNEFLRAKMNDGGGLDLFHHQGSGVLSSAVWGDGLIDNPAGSTIAAGDIVQFIPFSALLN